MTRSWAIPTAFCLTSSSSPAGNDVSGGTVVEVDVVEGARVVVVIVVEAARLVEVDAMVLVVVEAARDGSVRSPSDVPGDARDRVPEW